MAHVSPPQGRQEAAPGTQRTPLRPGREYAIALGLALGPAVGVGLARFAYALLLPAMRADLHWSFAIAGAMNTANALGYLAGALLATPLVRLWGARRAFSLSIALTALTLLATAGNGNTAVLVGLRAFAGVFGAITFTTGAGLVAAVGSVSSPRRAAALLGIYFAGGGAGIVASGLALPPLLAGTTASTGWRWGWVLLAASALAALIVAVPAALACREPSGAPSSDKRWPVSRLRPLLACYGLFGAGYIAYMTFIVAFLKGRGASSGEITAFWVVLGASAVASAFAWGPTVARLRAGRGPSLTMAVVCAGALLPLLSRSPFATMGSAVLFGGSFLAVVGTVTAVARRSLQPYHWAPVIATLTVSFATGQCLGPLLAGVLSDGSAGLRVGLLLSVGILASGSAMALAQRHHDTTAIDLGQCD